MAPIKRSIIKISLSIVSLLVLAACGDTQNSADNSREATSADTSEMSLMAQEKSAQWRSLFDGKTLNGWIGKDGAPLGKQWRVVDGQMMLTGSGGGDILTEELFQNFELSLDWKISKQGNSGIFYRVAPGSGAIWMSGLEYQILDDDDYPGLEQENNSETHISGSVFDIYPPQVRAVNPAMEYNHSRIVVKDNHVEHWLNGKKVVEFELWSDDWINRVKASKFADAEKFAKASRGRIGLQDHGHQVWFKNIKIREL